MTPVQTIQDRIHEVRGERVMLDFDLALLYEVPTKALNQAVKRNLKRFPDDFMFRLSIAEWQGIRSQPVTASGALIPSNSVSAGTFQARRNTKVTPYAFNEQGVAMLSSVLHSEKAINMNVAIMRAFVEIRRFVSLQIDIKEQLKQIQQRIGEHDTQLSQIYDAIENLLDEKRSQVNWEERNRIGFTNHDAPDK